MAQIVYDNQDMLSKAINVDISIDKDDPFNGVGIPENEGAKAYFEGE